MKNIAWIYDHVTIHVHGGPECLEALNLQAIIISIQSCNLLPPIYFDNLACSYKHLQPILCELQFLTLSESLPPRMKSKKGLFYKHDWLSIQHEKQKDVDLQEFIQSNPIVDLTMRTLLGNFLQLNDSSLQTWIDRYKKELQDKRPEGKSVHSIIYFQDDFKLC